MRPLRLIQEPPDKAFDWPLLRLGRLYRGGSGEGRPPPPGGKSAQPLTVQIHTQSSAPGGFGSIGGSVPSGGKTIGWAGCGSPQLGSPGKTIGWDG